MILTDLFVLNLKNRFSGMLWCVVTYLESLSSSCSLLRSLLSVLSGRPLAASVLARDTFGRFSGRGVPGPFTFLIDRQQKQTRSGVKKSILIKMKISDVIQKMDVKIKKQPLCKSRCVPRKHHSIHSIDSTASIFPVKVSSEKQKQMS